MTKSNGKLCTCQVCVDDDFRRRNRVIIPISDILMISNGVLDFKDEHDAISDIIKKEKARLFINKAPGGLIEEIVDYDVSGGIEHIKAPLSLARSIGLDIFDMIYLSMVVRQD